MKYRIMKVGDKFGAQIVTASGNGDYIQRGGEESWSNAKFVYQKCLCDTKEDAVLAGEAYIKPFNDLVAATELLESAEEIA